MKSAPEILPQNSSGESPVSSRQTEEIENAEGDAFDPALEIEKLKGAVGSAKRQKLHEFKEKLARQKEGLAEF